MSLGWTSIVIWSVLAALAVAAPGCARRPAGPARTPGGETVGGVARPAEAEAGTVAAPDAGAAAPRLIGIISPHAGYDYSGAVAGWAWSLLLPPDGASAADVAGAEAGGTSSEPFPPQVAGRFYPADPGVLRRAVRGFLEGAGRRADIAVGDVETIVVLSPSHYYRPTRIAILSHDAYRTPLGVARVDADLRARLLAELPEDVESNSDAFVREHAMEVQLPFAQVARPGAKVLPVVVGASATDRVERFGRALGRIARERPGIKIAASTDFSHFHPYDDAVAFDEEMLGALERLDLALLDRVGPSQRGLCGYYPVRVALAALLEAAGAGARVVRLRYANSGDVTGDRSGVVGYGALALVAGPAPEGPREEEAMYNRDERRTLIDIAKAAVRAAAYGEEYEPPEPASEALRRDGAAFVTLKNRGRLRGCIGHVVASMPLYRCVAEVARSAATEDHRFPQPVRPEELADLTYEVSVLTPPEPVADPATVTVGRDGLIVSRGGRRGLLLPQVPGQFGWNREQFLDATCEKAGLPPGCWREPGTRIERFQAVVWGESLDDSD